MSTTPVDPIVETFINGAWVDITADCRLGDADSGGGIDIERGRANESPIAEPTQLNFVLNNGPSKVTATLGETGVYSPKNPLGPYYGHLGRNQPVRVGLSRRLDDFQRTESSGWGDLPARTLPDGTTAPTETWVEEGSAAAFNVTPGAATIQAAGTTRIVSTGTYADVEVLTKMKVSNRTTNFGVLIRKAPSTTDWYSAYIALGGTDQLRIAKVYDNGVSARAVSQDLSSNIVADTWYWFRVQIRGQRIRVKFWADGASEPFLWNWRWYDELMDTEGQVGLTGRVGIYIANGTALTTVESFEINQWRAHAEITQLPPRWDISRNDRWVPISARGMLRRLGQGRKSLDSAVRQHLTTYATHGWLPLEESEGTTQAGNLATGGRPGIVSGLTFSGADTVKVPGIAGYATMSEDTSSVSMAILPHASTGAETLLIFLKIDAAPASDILLATVQATGTISQYKLYLQSNNGLRVDCLDKYNAIVDVSSIAALYGFADIPYGSWVGLTLYAFDSGANVEYTVNYHRPGSDSFYTLGSNTFAGSVGTMRSVTMRSSSVHTATGGVSVSHIFHHPGDLPFVTSEFARAAYAYIGELATTRFLRLTATASINATTTGYSLTSTEMGAQLPAKLLDLLEDCASVEDGILMEERDELGISLVTRWSLYNQEPIRLDIDAGHLSPPLEPTDDDQATRNHVTVSRPDGSFAVSVQTSGPLNINPPEDDPDGVGIYDEAPEINLASDDLLSPAANWRRARGTLVDPRYPSMHANLAASAYQDDEELAAKVASLDSGRLMVLTNPEVSPDDTEQLVQAYREHLDQYEWDMTFVTTPGALYRVGIVEYTSRLGSDYLVVESDFDAGADVAMTIERTDTTKGLFVLPADSAASFPMHIKASGVVLNVTSASGTSDPQTLTITQTPVNGVVKTIPAGSPIEFVDAWRVAR